MYVDAKGGALVLNSETFTSFRNYCLRSTDTVNMDLVTNSEPPNINNTLGLSKSQTSSSKTLGEKISDPLKYLESNMWDKDSLRKLSTKQREAVRRELLATADISCKTCPVSVRQPIKTFKSKDDLNEKLRCLCSKSELTQFFKKRHIMWLLCGNGDLLLNTMWAQCPICGSAISLGHSNNIFIKKDKFPPPHKSYLRHFRCHLFFF